MRGRRPKPSRLKVLTGNPGKHRLNAREPIPEIEPVLPSRAQRRSTTGIASWPTSGR